MIEKIKSKLRGNGFLLFVTIVLFFILYIAGAIAYGDRNFTSPQVFLNLFISNAGLIIAAVGMTFVLITGGIDISIGSVIGVVCMMLAWMMEIKHMSAGLAIILVLAFGILFGLVQGFLVAYLKIQPFIVTLGGMFFARGLTAVISSDMISIKNETFLNLANNKIYLSFITYYNNRGIPMHPYIYLSVVIAILVVAIAFVLLKFTKFGRAVFAVGGNEQSALLMGLNPRTTKLKVYVLNGFLASLAGFAFCLNSCGGFVEQARGFEMDAIAAAVIGGTLLTGGVGTVIGSLFGSLIKGIIETIITFQGTLSSWWTRIAIAALLCFFVILQSVFKSIREKRLAQSED
ncbi:ABC transporter permease subunit [Anaerostipes sp.]|uniref:ABC transporter permease subunit n=1 Tax=Anaerostipes sp. TaxID=1872530 RepID=UPI0025BE7A39|nr:sugar ABC transporter permease YjfF [Anaerostipes sp.]MBS7009017.1 sugar ABC transporter permease YjfF [Anaerostipes sp.]